MKLQHVLLALAGAAFPPAASAQNLKPGLWEVTQNMQGAGDMGAAMAKMQKEIANMPPEQRKMMEQMMAKQGMQMGAGPGGTSVRVCMTKEMVERNEIPAQKGDCKTTKQERSGNTMKFAFSCANPPSSGEGTHTIVSPEAYKSSVSVRSTHGGKPQTMTIDGSGKWIAADCGAIKPMRPPQK